MPLSEQVYCVAVAVKMTVQVEQWTCIKFCIKLEHSSMETICMIQKTAAMGNWWLAASSWQRTRSYIMLCRFFWQNIDLPRWLSPPNSPDLVPCDFWLLPKLKSPLNGKRFQTINEIQENIWIFRYFSEYSPNWENCVRSQGAYFEGAWGITVLCTMFLVSCVFFNTWFYFSYYMDG